MEGTTYNVSSWLCSDNKHVHPWRVRGVVTISTSEDSGMFRVFALVAGNLAIVKDEVSSMSDVDILVHDACLKAVEKAGRLNPGWNLASITYDSEIKTSALELFAS